MPTFGSFALLFALALSGYTLVAGAVALRQLAAGNRGLRFAGAIGGNCSPRRYRQFCRYDCSGLCAGVGRIQ